MSVPTPQKESGNLLTSVWQFPLYDVSTLKKGRKTGHPVPDNFHFLSVSTLNIESDNLLPRVWQLATQGLTTSYTKCLTTFYLKCLKTSNLQLKSFQKSIW